MKRRYLSLLAGAILFGGLLFAQAPPPKATPKAPEKGATLESILELTLKQNADIKVAESKVRDAELELNRARHTVLTKVNSLYSDLQAARAQLRTEELKLVNALELHKQRTISQQEVRLAQGAVEQQQAAVQKLEAELKAIRGEFSIPVPTTERAALLTKNELTLEDRFLEEDRKNDRIMEGEEMLKENEPDLIPEKIRKQIQSVLGAEIPINTDEIGSFRSSTLVNFGQVVRERKLPFFILANMADWKLGGDEQHTAREENMSISAAIAFIEDSLPACKFVVKDYGLALVSKDKIPKGSVDWRKLMPDYKKKPGA